MGLVTCFRCHSAHGLFRTTYSHVLIILIILNTTLVSQAFITSEKQVHRKYRNNESSAALNNEDRAPVKEDKLYSLWSSDDAKMNHTSNFYFSRSKDSLAESAETLSSFLQNFANKELGIIEAKKFYQSTSIEMIRSQGLEDKAKRLGDIFSAQIESYHEAVETLVESVKSLSFSNESLQLEKCCELNSDSFMLDVQYNLKIRKDIACWSAGSKSKSNLFVPSLFNQAMLKNVAKLPHIKWQYFISPEGVYVEYPANSHNCKSSDEGPRPIFRPKTHLERKIWLIEKSKEDSRIHRVVFLIQLGRNPSTEIIKSMKNIVIMLLRFLDEADEVGILNVNPDEVWTDFLCDQLVPVTPWTRYQILSYLNFIEHRYKSSQQQQFSEEQNSEYSVPMSALNKSVQMACANFSSSAIFPPSAATIIHLTAELNTNKTQGVLNSPCPIYIESYFLRSISKEDELVYKNNLESMASKNIWNIQVNSMSQMEPESFAIKVALKLNSKKDWWSLSDILSQFFPEEKETSIISTDFSLPLWNPVSKEAVIVAKKYVFENGHALGLVAIEVPVIHFTQHITYFLNENVCDAKNYAFLIDTKGRVIAHPALGKPGSSEEVLSPIQIEQVEVYQGFSTLHQRLISAEEPTGCYSLRLRAQNDWVTYAWSRVHNYIVAIVVFGDTGGCIPDREEAVLRRSFLSPKSDIQHHFLLQKSHCCGNQEFSTAKAALYLSPSAFSKPASALSHFTPSHGVKHSLALMAYLSDNSGLLQNQNKGLQPAVKDHVGVLSNIIPLWKLRYRTSIWSKYIQRRFASGGGGSFLLMYPGISVLQGHVPHSSLWFRQGVKGNGDLMFNPPIVNYRGTPTSSLAVVVRSEGASGVDIPVAVLGATVTIGYFRKLIEEIIPECKRPDKKKERNISIRCFLIDKGGYVIYHPQLARTLHASAPVHITQLEPLSVIDILQYTTNPTEIPMRKHTCHKLSDTSATQESIQRFYTISMGLDGIKKLKHGEMCNWYQILPLAKTNLFFGVVQDNCTSAPAFCPCSTVDNLCLNCLRIEPTDCECPCECPREPNFCAKQGFAELPETEEPCEFPNDPIPLDASSCESSTQNQSSCDLVWSPCENILEQQNCIGIYDCEWCETREYPPRFHCATFKNCYGYGFLQEKSEMKDDFAGGADPSPDTSFLEDGKRENETQITIVPILGVLSVFIFFLGLVGYCYRHRSLRSSSSQPDVHLLPLQGSPIGSIAATCAGSSRSNSDTEEPVPLVYMRRHRRGPGRSVVAPPRSPLGSVFTESDHGYSTMTHNDDNSEAGASLTIHSIDPVCPSRHMDNADSAPAKFLVEPRTLNTNILSASSNFPCISVPASVEQVLQ